MSNDQWPMSNVEHEGRECPREGPGTKSPGARGVPGRDCRACPGFYSVAGADLASSASTAAAIIAWALDCARLDARRVRIST